MSPERLTCSSCTFGIFLASGDTTLSSKPDKIEKELGWSGSFLTMFITLLQLLLIVIVIIIVVIVITILILVTR